MCGIFGIALCQDAEVSRGEFTKLLEKLYLLSESRGKESAGLHLYLPQARQAWTIKGVLPASELIRASEFRKTIAAALELVFASNSEVPIQPVIAIAHSRLVTNGSAEQQKNNQPVRWGDVTVIHNGIVVNVDKLWRERPQLQRYAEVDTEVVAAMIANAMDVRFDPVAATQEVYEAIEGAASIAWVHSSGGSLVLASNTGDLYHADVAQGQGLVFASEHFILESSLRDLGQESGIEHVHAGSGLCLQLNESNPPRVFTLSRSTAVDADVGQRHGKSAQQHDLAIESVGNATPIVSAVNESLLRYNEQAMRALKRCTCCVLPETFPFIAFDEQGVCNYCRGYKPKYKGVDPDVATASFLQSIEKYRRADGCPDVLVPFSGGRDSCYGLHLIKREFGLNPITFTYDWGMVTDLARRNIARFCGKLGVQNILISADIKTKRENIRKNVSAWLRKPDLGMVPLFMAGDKHFFQILNGLKKQTGINLNIWSANPLENTDFKVGLCGVKPVFDKHRVDHLSITHKFRLLAYYGMGFLTNQGMINSSLMDTASAFLSYYFEPRKDFISLFHHMIWDEAAVNSTIISNYGFELATDSPSSWRIGDGTAPFYNYIYMTANGFSEFDTFRSNQIREGQITREEALDHIVEENRPRVDGLRWYLEVIGLDFNEVIAKINQLDVRGLHA